MKSVAAFRIFWQLVSRQIVSLEMKVRTMVSKCYLRHLVPIGSEIVGSRDASRPTKSVRPLTQLVWGQLRFPSRSMTSPNRTPEASDSLTGESCSQVPRCSRCHCQLESSRSTHGTSHCAESRAKTLPRTETWLVGWLELVNPVKVRLPTKTYSGKI